MATLTTSPQVIGQNLGNTMNTRLYGWYGNQVGNSCTVYVRLTVTNTGSTYTGTNKSYGISVGGYNSGVQEWSYQPLNTNQEYTIAEASWGYNGGNQISAGGLYWTYVYGSADITSLTDNWYVPTFTSPPTGLSVSVAELYPDGAKFNVSVSSYGNPSSASGRYIEAGILGTSAYTDPRRYAATYNTSSSAIVVDNTSTGAMNIQPNTQYYYGGYATNTQVSVSNVFGQLVTLAPEATLTLDSATSRSATFDYSTLADGGFYDKTLQYSIDNGTTWTTFATITGGTATTGTFMVSGLDFNTSYTLKSRVVTTAGTTDNTDISFTTNYRLYGSVNNQTKEVQKLYGSVNGQTKEIKKLYASVGGVTKRIF